MIFHENLLLALSKIEKNVANLSSAAVVIGALRVNFILFEADDFLTPLFL